MNMSRKLGLSLVAAALLTLYGCGKEEPKKAAEAPKAPAAPVEEVVVVKIGEDKMLSVSESMDEEGHDRGPVNALSKALVKDLGPYQGIIADMKLVDYKVRITQGGTEAVTRVIIDAEDKDGHRCATVGVSANIVDASFEALLDAIQWKLIRDIGAPK